MLFFTTEKKHLCSMNFCSCAKLNRFPNRQNGRLSLPHFNNLCSGESPMSYPPKNRILIVDDDQSIRVTVAMVLASKEYEVSTAENGFDALLQMKSRVPELVISDLNMPQMSGFEFLSVIRRRFPQILVVAMSGAHPAADAVPGGGIADAFYAKSANDPRAILDHVAGPPLDSALRAA